MNDNDDDDGAGDGDDDVQREQGKENEKKVEWMRNFSMTNDTPYFMINSAPRISGPMRSCPALVCRR